MSLQGKTVLITGGAVRIGRTLSLAIAERGGDVIVHYGRSKDPAEKLQAEIQAMGRSAHLVQADLSYPRRATQLVTRALNFGPIFAVVNNASIFEPLTLAETSLEDWDKHFAINLTAPFLISQAFAASIRPGEHARIINILDWRALRPGSDHFPYSVSKAGLAALTRALATALAPDITVNGIAFGAILPPSDGGATENLLSNVPARRWAELREVAQTLIFLLDGPSYITGEIIHLDGGRHLI
jgi:NAD(P)-dependent dehydrogenase (short-subunit alcohol dehydrogenase family)